MVEGLAEELLHVRETDARLGVTAIEHEANLVLIITQCFKGVHTYFHVFYRRQEVDDAKECHDGRLVEHGEIQRAEHRGHVDEDVIELTLQRTHRAHGVVVVDVVGFLEQLRRGQYGEVHIRAVVRRQEVLDAARVALDLHRALKVGQGLRRLELQEVADIAELKVEIDEADAVALAGQLRRHVAGDERLADGRSRAEKGDDNAVDRRRPGFR